MKQTPNLWKNLQNIITASAPQRERDKRVEEAVVQQTFEAWEAAEKACDEIGDKAGAAFCYWKKMQVK